MTDLENKIFTIKNSDDFEKLALAIFQFQVQNLSVYREYLKILKINPVEINSTNKIPFLPIQFFKTKTILTEGYTPKLTFTSSGTSGNETSKHLVAKPDIYIKSFVESFKYFFGNIERYCILALLPSYLERQESSLVYMVDYLIKQTNHPDSGFYLDEYEKLYVKLKELDSKNQNVIFIGVTFALLDFAEKFQMNLKHTVVMETGGMKGRRSEIIREDLHKKLRSAFGVKIIYSEYGMTELLSQAYSTENGIFKCPPWMKILIRDPYDPFTPLQNEKTGGVNVVDLANLYSCSFIQTDDLGRVFSNGSFEILGRMEGSQLRGCNQLVY